MMRFGSLPILCRDAALLGGGSGGYVNLSSPSTAVASTAPETSTNPVFGSVTTNFASPGASGGGDMSIIYLGLFALAAIFFVKEVF